MTEARQTKSSATATRPAPLAMVFVRDVVSKNVLQKCLSELDPDSVSYVAGSIEDAITALTHRPSPRLLVVDISGIEDSTARIGELAQVCEPNTGVIAIGDVNDVSLYRGLKASGIVEYFYKPLVGNLVGQACAAVLAGNNEQQVPHTGKLVFVMGVKGGVGATSIAIGAAWHLADVRHRRVLVLDLDLTSGDAALQLDVLPNHALWEALDKPDRVDNLFLERGVIHVTPRLDLLASLEPLGQASLCREGAVLSLLTNLLTRYRYVFVDLPQSLAPQLMGILELPSTFILVCDESLVSARDVVRWRAKIGANTPARQTLYVINKAGAHGSLSLDAFVRAVGQPPTVTIPYKREIGIASVLGVQGVAKDGTMAHALAPLLMHIAGEAVEEKPTFLSKLLG